MATKKDFVQFVELYFCLYLACLNFVIFVYSLLHIIIHNFLQASQAFQAILRYSQVQTLIDALLFVNAGRMQKQ